MCQYPVYKVRKDMSSQEYEQYKMEWNVFNSVWIYNYTITSLNMIATIGDGIYSTGNLGTYEFNSGEKRISYRKGQDSHVAAYPASSFLFTTIPPINMSTYAQLSTTYTLGILSNISTTEGISTFNGNLARYLGNISTLSELSTIRSVSTLNQNQVSTISTIISPFDVSTFNGLEGIGYISSIVYNVQTETTPSTLLPIGPCTLAFYVSSEVLSLNTASSFVTYVSTFLNPLSRSSLSTLTTLSSISYFNKAYYLNEPSLSTYSSLSTLLSYNIKYANFSASNISVLYALSNTFPYPPSRVSTYTSLSTLAYLSSIYQYTSTAFSTIRSLSTTVGRSTMYSSTLTESSLSTLKYLSSHLSLYHYLNGVSVGITNGNISTLATLSTYTYFL
jgi:hypothetical protein